MVYLRVDARYSRFLSAHFRYFKLASSLYVLSVLDVESNGFFSMLKFL